MNAERRWCGAVCDQDDHDPGDVWVCGLAEHDTNVDHQGVVIGGHHTWPSRPPRPLAERAAEAEGLVRLMLDRRGPLAEYVARNNMAIVARLLSDPHAPTVPGRAPLVDTAAVAAEVRRRAADPEPAEVVPPPRQRIPADAETAVRNWLVYREARPSDEDLALLLGHIERLGTDLGRAREDVTTYERYIDAARPVATEPEPPDCPVGDPGCDAPADGEWHCHDGCAAPAHPRPPEAP